TRLRSLGGEMLVFPNSAMTSARIQNYSDLTTRRTAFNFSVPLDTPAATLAKIPDQIRALARKIPDLRLERAHVCGILDIGFQFEVVFYTLSGDYTLYMDRQQTLLLGLIESLAADGIPLAQPTRNVVISGQMP
ncbi:MAG: mechanosensitive ion channel family protein, partial [Elusimicrobia bacterium]|nr:mechanosensitive ion channel family protein [Elusimicrobiota bacterium]